MCFAHCRGFSCFHVKSNKGKVRVNIHTKAALTVSGRVELVSQEAAADDDSCCSKFGLKFWLEHGLNK